MIIDRLSNILHPSAKGKLWLVFVFIFLVVAAAGIYVGDNYYNVGVGKLEEKTGGAVKLPKVKETNFRLGLDLLGGTHLVYEADMKEVPEADRKSALEGVRDVIERRVNVFGVSEPIVQTSITGGHYRIIVELAGIREVSEAIKMIGETPLLEFKEQDDQIRELTEEEREFLESFNREAEEKAEDLLGKLYSGGDFESLAREFSDDQNFKEKGGDLGWLTEAEAPDIIAKVKDLEIGGFTPDLITTGQGYEFYKLEDKRIKTNPFDETETEKEIRAAHILICYEGASRCEEATTRDEALLKIEAIKKSAALENFSDLAKEHSTEPGAEQTGGDLGWFGRGMMVEEFQEEVFKQEVNSISDIVETQFGFHLIYKQDERATEEYRVRAILIGLLSEQEIIGEALDWKNTELTGKHLKRASVQFNPNDNTPEVSLEFDSEGGKLFEEITGRNVGRPVAIFLDGYPISVPMVNEKIRGGSAVISGKFNDEEAKLLARRLNAGALPVPINIISQQTVGASLGHESLALSLKAGIIGLILLIVFLIIIYRLPGLLAVISLIFYGILVLALFKLFGFTLTLAGIAGFILSIGLAVDANVLIFERLKEELKLGKPVNTAIEESFRRAWPSIRDGNISTLITCFILMQFTTSIVKGFAVTLFVGVCISMFSAIIITRNLLMIVSGDWLERKLWLLGAGKKLPEQD